MAFMRLNKCFQLNAKDKINCNTYMLKNSLCFVLSSCILCSLKKKKKKKKKKKTTFIYLFIVGCVGSSSCTDFSLVAASVG